MVVRGRCGLFANHSGQCAIKVETKTPIETGAQVPLDLNLDQHDPGDTWKPGRDLPLY